MDQTLLLGSLVQDHEVFGSDHLTGEHVKDFGADLGQEHLDDLILGRGLHIGVIVEEIADEGRDEFGVLAGVGAVGAGLVHGLDLGLGA